MSNKFNVSLEGHSAVVEYDVQDGGHVVGTLTSPDYGAAPIEQGYADPEEGTQNVGIHGQLTLHGVTAKFDVVVTNDTKMTGQVRIGWFYTLNLSGERVVA